MDGNRRFATRRGIDRHSGHVFGYDSLMRVLKVCFDLKVRVVTLYAFSIDNYQRSFEEVSALMELIQSKLESLIEKEDLVTEHGVRVRVLGDLSLLPDGVRNAAERAMYLTKNNSSALLNLCISYTSTQEIVHSVQTIRDELVCKYRKNIQVIESQTCLRNGEIKHPSNLWGVKKRSHQDSFDVVAKKDSVSENMKLGWEVLEEDALNCPFNKQCRVPFSRQVECCMHLGHWKECVESSGKLANDMGSGKCGMGRQQVWEDDVSDIAGCRTGKREGFVKAENPSTVELIRSRARDCSGSELSKNRLINNCKSGHHCDADDNDLLKLVTDHVTEGEIQQHLYTESCPAPDIVIRTSGETRLSNFLLWQTSLSHLAFCNVLWPEFSFRHLFFVILEYQTAYSYLLGKRRLCNQILSKRHEASCSRSWASCTSTY